MTYQTVFPLLSRHVATAFAETAPILIDGMKVQFDEKVALYPARVELEEVNNVKRTRPATASSQRSRRHTYGRRASRR
jgi:hypothetical protein